MSLMKEQLRRSFNVQSEMFRPVWLRALIVGICFAWAGLELFVSGSAFWALMSGAIGAYLFHQFFIAFNPVDKDDPDSD